MKNTPLTNVFFIVAALFYYAVSWADNPVIQNNYTADPAPMVYNGRVYLFTSHDDDVIEANFYTMRNYCCYSSADMVNWTDHGIVATLKEFKWITVNNGAWAPQCVERDGKFYLYIPIQGKGIGVQVADSPTGPFKDPIGKALVNKNGYNDIDPTVFVDNDGQAYLYWGNPTLYYVKLNKDMTSYTGNVETANPKPTSYIEGPWFYKRNNLYYLVYAAMGGGSENIQYATSSSPTGPWSSKGVIMPTQGSSFTNHPGVCDFKDNSYLFYHNAALPGGGSYHRSVCVEQFTYKADGTIPSLSMSTAGVTQVGSLNPYDTVQAETICWEQGVETEVCSEGGMNVTNIENNDYIKIKGIDFGDEASKFYARVASSITGGKIELRLDSQTGQLIGTCEVGNTGGAQSWATKSCAISGAKGKHDLFLKFTGSGSSIFKFNWWKFESSVGVLEKNSMQTSSVKVFADQGKKIKISLSLPQNAAHENPDVRIFDLQGHFVDCVLEKKLNSDELQATLNPGRIAMGTYVLQIMQDKKILVQNSLIINR